MMRTCHLLLCLIPLLLAGCQDDEIRRYQVPKPETLPQGPSHIEKTERLLAVIIPRGDKTWFVKLLGPTSNVGEHEAEFDSFVQSVNFKDQDKEPMQWKLPAGWKAAPQSPGRYATIHIGPEDAPLKLTVHVLGPEARGVQANVDRWRRTDLGLGPIPMDKLEEVAKPIKVDGEAATRVDMSGPGAKKSKKMPPFAAPRLLTEEREPAPLALQYKAPEGWKEKPPNPQVNQLAAWQVPDGAALAEVTITPAGGSLPDNINRWRGQVGLGPADEEQLKKDMRRIEVAGVPGLQVELVGPEGAGRERQRIIGVVFLRDQQAWFIKMRGPADLVAKQKPAFESFVRSVKFAGSKGGKDG